MLLLSSKEGRVVVLEDPDNSDKFDTILDLESRMCHNGERGLQSIRPHPDFASNRYLYVFYAQENNGCLEDYETGPRNRLSRFTMDADTLEIDVDSELILMETPPLPKRVHNGGNIAFGNDGKLYVTTGDGGSRSPAVSLDLGHLHGKILRLNDDGSIPSDNPHASDGVACGTTGGQTSSGVCAEVFALGCRNPFRLAMDPNTVDKVKFHIGDVGGSQWEEISVGGTDYPLANYGWPVMEGPCNIHSNTECPTRSEFQDPIYYYEHTKSTEGGAVTGSVFVPDGIWPSKYKFLFVDFIFGKVYNLIEDDSRECRDCVPPVPAYRNETFHDFKDMVDIFFGPYNGGQALYIVSRTDGQNIRRIRYTDSSNRSPVANFTVDDTSAMIGEVLSFDGSASSDPDGDGLTYMWDFGDGSASALESPQYAYTRNGAFAVTLTVEDTGGLTSQTYIVVSVGTPPKAEMLSPAEGATFSVGENLILSGYGQDSIGNELNSSQIFWEVRQHHASHFHPFLDKTAGNDIDLYAAPGPEDFMAATNSFLRIIMYAVDSFGVTTEISRDVLPKLVYIDIDSVPQQMNVLVDEYPVETPGTITSWQNHKLHLDVEDQYPFTFASWSDGGLRSHTMLVPEASSSYPYVSAMFQVNASAYEPIDFVSTVKNCSSTDLCGRCEGHCQSDAECAESLICFQKGGKNLTVPGCLGLDPSNTDWCTTDSGLNLSSIVGATAEPTPSPFVVAPVGIPFPEDHDPVVQPTRAPVEQPTPKPSADATDEPITLIRGKPSANGTSTSGVATKGLFSISCVVGVAVFAFAHLA